MSVADIRKKGFGKKQKVKLIKENIMCGHLMSQNASASLNMTIPSEDGESGSKPLPAVTLWGGSTIYNEKVVRLRNTCTIDNFLTMFHFICLSNPSIYKVNETCFTHASLKYINFLKLGILHLANCIGWSCFHKR